MPVPHRAYTGIFMVCWRIPLAYTPTLGVASFLFVICTAIFFLLVGIVFWTSHAIRHNRFSTRYFFIPSVLMYLVDLFGEHREKTKENVGRPRFVIPKVVAVVGVFLFAFSYIGYQVPQKVGLVQIGQDIFYSKGQCALCHRIGTGAGRCPNLSGVGARLTRGFIYEALTEPNAYIKLDFNSEKPVDFSAQMPAINKPPIGLSEQEMLTIIAFMQSNGGKVTVRPEELGVEKAGF